MQVFAQHRSEQEAVQIAQEFFASKKARHPSKLVAVSLPEVRASRNRNLAKAQQANGQDCGYYIVNDEANCCFVIVSADERMHTVLGYSDNGQFNQESIPEGLMEMLAEYNCQYSLLLANNEQHVQQPVKNTNAPIPYMIRSKWGQDNPYNDQCPKDDNGQQCITGCVATAMAQVMNYHQWPSQGSGIVSYEPIPYIFEVISQSLDFNNLTIDWNNIADTYDASTPQIQKDEVAKLMHACGVSVYMDYGPEDSGADDPNIAYALINNFRYNPNIYYAAKKYYNVEEWNGLIQDELLAGRPIIYGGGGAGGHQFVLDGMDADGLYHFNFGWEGSHDGYYALDAISPGLIDYTTEQAMTIGVCKTETGIHRDVFYTDEFKLDTIINVGGKSKILYLKPYCFSNEANTYVGKARFKGEYGVGVFDKDFNYVKTLYRYTSNKFTARSVQTSFSGDGNYITFDNTLFTEGTQYYIAPYAKGEKTEKPTLMRTLNGYEDWYRASVIDGKVILERKKTIDKWYVNAVNDEHFANTPDGSWFNMKGIRINGKPIGKGIYLHNGRKVIIK